MCDPRAKPPQTQNGHPKPKKHHLAKQRQKHFNPHRAPHRNTPLNPLSRGETSTPQTTHYQKETSISNLPSQEGQGGVTSVHSFLKPKRSPEAKKHLLTKQQQNNLCPHCTLHRTPLYPLSENGNPPSQKTPKQAQGEYHIQQPTQQKNHSYQTASYKIIPIFAP